MKRKELFFQIFRFAIVGVIAAIIDVGTLTFLKECLHIDVLLSSAISFSVSVVVNYILSMSFVFKGKKQNKVKEFVIFILLSVGGLCLNQFIMWFGVKYIPVHYLVIKFSAMVFVPVYNFITRKLFLEEK